MSSHQSSESNILEQSGNICNYKLLYQSSNILGQPGNICNYKLLYQSIVGVILYWNSLVLRMVVL